MHRRGVTGDIIYVVVHREDIGGIITEDRCDMMMMMEVPNQIFQKEINNIFGYCFPSMIRNFTRFAYDVCKVVLDYR